LIPQLKNGVNTFVSAANKVKTNNIIKHLNTLVENLSITQEEFANTTQILTTGLGETISNNHQATELASQIYHGLGASTEGMQIGANNLLNVAQIIQDSQLGIELNKAAQGWQNAQIEFTNSTTIFSQATKNLQPVAAKLEPTIASIDRVVSSLQQVGSEVVNLSKNNVQTSESTQTAIASLDRNYQQILNSSNLSIQNFEKSNSFNWQSLIDTLKPKIQNDRESLKQLLDAIEKLEIIGSDIRDISNGERKSGFLGLSQRN
jgi:predicted transcriptional regulator